MELSYYLKEFSLQDAAGMVAKAAEAAEKVKAAEDMKFLPKMLMLLKDSTYRRATALQGEVDTRNSYIKHTAAALATALKVTDIADLPVVVATNIMYAAPALDVDMTETINSTCLPLLKQKLSYTSLENLADAIVGAAKLGLKDAALYKTLFTEFGARDKDFTYVQTSTWNHGEFQAPEATGERSVTWEEKIQQAIEIMPKEIADNATKLLAK